MSLIGNNMHLTPVSKPEDPQIQEKLKTKDATLSKNLTLLKKCGIVATGMLPISSRSVIANFGSAPLHLTKSLVFGIRDGVKNRDISSFSSTFSDKMEKYAGRDLDKGISDKYVDLKPDSGEAKEIAKNNLIYAEYQEGLSQEDVKGKGTIFLSEEIDTRSIPEENRKGMKEMGGELLKLGFKQNEEGMFLDLKTGTALQLIYRPASDQSNKEIIISFKGLGYEAVPNGIDKENKAKFTFSSVKAVAIDFLGGIPKSATQAMEIGEKLKDIAGKNGMTPVVIGNSHGGELAQCAAVQAGIKCIIFNSQPMGAGVRRFIGQEKVAANAKNITVFSSKGDFLSQNKAINALASGAERLLGIPLPRTVAGTCYNIPRDENQTGRIALHTGYTDSLKILAETKSDILNNNSAVLEWNNMLAGF